MSFRKNQFGVPQYPLDDARRLFVLAAAIDLLERPTSTAIADLTGIDNALIEAGVGKLCEQYGMVIHNFGEIYRIESWGEFLNRNNVSKAMKPLDQD